MKWLIALALGVFCCSGPLMAQTGFPPDPEAGPGLSADGAGAGFEELLAQRDGQEFQFQGRTYVWLDGAPHEKNPDGSLQALPAPEGEGELYILEAGRQWLTQGADGTIYINVAPRIWAQVHFQHNSDVLEPDSKEVLDVFGRFLSAPGLAGHRLIIAGHTDHTGAPAYNLELSRRRALSVGRYLEEAHGLEPHRLILTGYGDQRPMTGNDTEEGRAQNRRVEFILLGPPAVPAAEENF